MGLIAAAKRLAGRNGVHKNGKVQAPAPKPALGDDEAERLIPLARIKRNPENPRTEFDQTELEQLAVSIREFGVLSPILVRPHPGATGIIHAYELVDGERRFRAASMAGLRVIPAKVRKLTDAEVLQIMAVSFEHRKDISPLEKADLYFKMIHAHGIKIDDIAQRIGRSVSTIRGLLKMLTLPAIARDATKSGHLPMATAQLIARVPGIDAAKEVAHYVLYGGDEYSWSGKPPDHNDVVQAIKDGVPPMSVRMTKQMIEEKYMVELKGAPFDRGLISLDLVAGTCDACPKRVGNLAKGEPENYAGIRADMCTDPACFKRKCEKNRLLQEAQAKAKGQTVLTAKQCAKEFSKHYSDRLAPDSNYVDLDDRCDADKKHRTFGELIGKKVEAAVVTAFDRDGKRHRLVARQFAAQALKKECKITIAPKASVGYIHDPEKWKKQEEEMDRSRKLKTEVALHCLEPAAAAAMKIAADSPLASLRNNSPALKLLRVIAVGAIHRSFAVLAAIAARRGLVKSRMAAYADKAILKLVPSMPAEDLIALLAEHQAGVALMYPYASPEQKAIVAHLDIDLGAIEKKAKADLAVEASK